MKLDGKIKVPHPLKPRVLLWADVSYNDMDEIDNIKSIPELERTLCRVLAVDFSEPRKGVLLELFVHTVLFCRENKFNREQTSALISIVKNMHQANTETPLNNVDHCFAYCSELLLCHSVRVCRLKYSTQRTLPLLPHFTLVNYFSFFCFPQRPPFSINLFSCDQVTHILKYLLNSYIKHFNLYKYIFTPQVRLDLTLCYSGMPDVEDPPSPELLDMPDAKPVTQQKPETEQEEQLGMEEKAALGTSPEETAAEGPSHRSELRALIQQEVKQEMVRVSTQLEQQLRASADKMTSTLASLESSLQGKK
ncbi:coiled-coil domain-containing protein 189 isoform X1 [Hypomesus transpacificus]|uniref:coiled-coil domain-containing protein 189 isoform X1 n=1 Tax=Hypomesus transpacificus TaxID=137520 RepID=UPI001F0783AA|nr:coiled-coil domain-containing protein 189 isoform X1 [Hypomesus transpacificus]